CLIGTRTDMLSAIVTWAAGGMQPSDCPPYLQALDPNKNVLWLCGLAGSGKSSIAMSVAHSLDSLGLLGGFYCFSAANQAALHPSKLFSTLALQLAAQNKHMQQRLLSIIQSADAHTRASLSPTQQLETFLLPLLKPSDTSPTPAHTVMIIDALDESGTVSTRAEILQLLAKLGSMLPSTVHILITSRFEHDIQKTL
ncbi:hypothetical protein DL93DRAFT_2028324, partial [Clavulina sp. PMI_390]